MTLSRFFRVFVLVALVTGVSASAKALLKPESSHLLELASQATTEENDSKLKELKGQPRAGVLAAFREALKEGDAWNSVIARASIQLDAVELLPDLRNRASASGDWNLLSACDKLSRDEDSRKKLHDLEVSLLPKADAAAKVVILDTLATDHFALPASLFDSLVKDSVFEVRQATVRQFLESRETYSSEEQIRRFKTSFALKPYQVRLEALKAYLDLKPQARRKLASAFDPKLCSGETQTEVKRVCNEAAKKSKAGTP